MSCNLGVEELSQSHTVKLGHQENFCLGHEKKNRVSRAIWQFNETITAVPSSRTISSPPKSTSTKSISHPLTLDSHGTQDQTLQPGLAAQITKSVQG